MTPGRFVTFEGGEGAGKSTQVKRLAGRLREIAIDPVLTREPGGCPGAEDIRALLVRGEPGRWSALTEALLHYAARREHLDRAILPALKAGRWVISDRFADSTVAYQGYGHGLGAETIERIHALVVGDFAPDLTLILDLPVRDGLRRAAARAVPPGSGRKAESPPGGSEDRYERMDGGFHERMRQGFLDIARREPKRCVVIDAAGDADAVADAVWAAVETRLPRRKG